jgi:predicted nucleic acid-binding protein
VIVVDASVLADALLDDGPMGAAARTALTSDPHWAAPAHLLVEVVSVIRGSVIRGKTLGGKLEPTRANEAVAALSELVVDQVDISQLVDRIWQLRGNLTAYDAAYVAAAEALECPLVTGDGRLPKASGPHCEIRVISGP